MRGRLLREELISIVVSIIFNVTSYYYIYITYVIIYIMHIYIYIYICIYTHMYIYTHVYIACPQIGRVLTGGGLLRRFFQNLEEQLLQSHRQKRRNSFPRYTCITISQVYRLD